MQQHGYPEIFNTDQGSQFTSEPFTKLLLDKEVQISMDSKGRAIDNILLNACRVQLNTNIFICMKLTTA